MSNSNHTKLSRLVPFSAVQTAENQLMYKDHNGEEHYVKAAPFDWRLGLLERIAEVTPSDNYTLLELRTLAREWPTCACGNMCSVLPRSKTFNNPEDRDLSILGHRFYEALDEAYSCELEDNTNDLVSCLKNAVRIMERIEARTCDLLVNNHGFIEVNGFILPPNMDAVKC